MIGQSSQILFRSRPKSHSGGRRFDLALAARADYGQLPENVAAYARKRSDSPTNHCLVALSQSPSAALRIARFDVDGDTVQRSMPSVPTRLPSQLTTSTPYRAPGPSLTWTVPTENVNGPELPVLAAVRPAIHVWSCQTPVRVGSTWHKQVSAPWVLRTVQRGAACTSVLTESRPRLS